MNDPYNGNGRKSPEDDLGRSIEKEVKETIGTVAAALQDAAREVSTSLRDNESVQRTVKDLGAAARDGVQGIQSAIAQAQKNAEKEKRRRKRRDYAKKANGALSEAGGLMLPAGILAACAFSAFEPGDPARGVDPRVHFAVVFRRRIWRISQIAHAAAYRHIPKRAGRAFLLHTAGAFGAYGQKPGSRPQRSVPTDQLGKI